MHGECFYDRFSLNRVIRAITLMATHIVGLRHLTYVTYLVKSILLDLTKPLSVQSWEK
jgi:hypothetical protein